MKVLSLFDGASCARLALRKIGVKPEYYASEIDEYAMKITRKNFPNTIQIGDITKLRNGDLPRDVDLLIGGSPCQGLSSANNSGLGLEDERSKLFWEYVRILNKVKPRYFVLENVRPRFAKDQTAMTNALGVHPVLLDSQLVSAQRRKRLFWTNIPNIKPPKLVPSRIYPDNKIGLVIADILEPDAERRKVFIKCSKPGCEYECKNKPIYCPNRPLIKTSYGVRWNQAKKGAQSRKAVDQDKKGFTVDTCINRKYGYNVVQENKPQGQTAHFIERKHDTICAGRTTQKTNIVRGSNYGLQGNYAVNADGKHNALINSNLKGNVNVVVDHNSTQNRAYDSELKSKPIVAFTAPRTNVVFDDLRIEQLTWTEIERLQGMPDGYTDLGEENRVEARGRAIGNAMEGAMMAHLLSHILPNLEPLERSADILIGEQIFLF